MDLVYEEACFVSNALVIGPRTVELIIYKQLLG